VIYLTKNDNEDEEAEKKSDKSSSNTEKVSQSKGFPKGFSYGILEKASKIQARNKKILQNAFIGKLQDFKEIQETMNQVYNMNKVVKPIVERYQKMMEPIINNPELVHYSEVKNAYNKDNDKVVVILLNVFFESVLEEWLEDWLEETKEESDTKGSEKKLLSKLDYDGKLRFGRISGIINEDTYCILNSIRDARNDFVHDFSKYSMMEAEEILENTRVEDAIELYEKMLRIDEDESMLNNEEKDEE